MILGNQLCLGQKREVYVYQGSLQKREHFRIFLFRPRSKTDRESSGANRGRKGGARERADDVLLFRRNKRTSEQSGLCSDVVPVAGVDLRCGAGRLRLQSAPRRFAKSLRVRPPAGLCKISQRRWHCEILVPVAGVEPARPCGHGILSPGRLPIPPHRRMPALYRV